MPDYFFTPSARFFKRKYTLRHFLHLVAAMELRAPHEKQIFMCNLAFCASCFFAESKVSMFGKANVPVAKRPQEVPVLLATLIRNAD